MELRLFTNMYELSTKNGWQEDNKQRSPPYCLASYFRSYSPALERHVLICTSHNPKTILDSPSKTFTQTISGTHRNLILQEGYRCRWGYKLDEDS